LKPGPAGLYVHFPLCLSVCPYCDFVVHAGAAARGPGNRIEQLVRALIAEMALRSQPSRLASVYLGGGTPSLLSPGQVGRLLAAADDAFGLAGHAEVTIEVNPGPDERGDLAGFRAAGVNRVSIGAQSFVAGELHRLARRHSPQDIGATAMAARRAGFANVSMDLLYDVPGQTLDSWRVSLAAALRLPIDHVSAYSLTLDDPDTEGLTGPRGDHLPLRRGARQWRARARPEQDGDRAAGMYELADDMLARAGLYWYEISNWARPGSHSRHNLAYWHGRPWEAVGPGAHRYDGVRTRAWNAASLAGYLAALESGRLPPGDAETIDERTSLGEQAMLRLRTVGGLPVYAARRAELRPALDWAVANGLTEAGPRDAVRLSRRGRLMADELFVRMMPD
jgi:putative oxygen-independent coproporphyrinogen III oxidase